MKIIYYSPHPHLNLMSPAGFGTHMREMITAFRKEGCEVLPVIMGGQDKPPKEEIGQSKGGLKDFVRRGTPDNLWRTLKDLNLLRFDYATASDRLEEAINQFRPECIYERGNYLQMSGVKLAKKYDIPHAMEINSPYVDQNNFLGKSRSYLEKYARNIEKKQLMGTDLPLAVVGPLKDFFSKRYAIDPDQFLVTHDAFNKDNIRLDSGRQQQIIDRYKLSDKTVIGYIGSIFEWHGLDKLIKAFDELDLADTTLFIVGYGEYMVHLIELTKALDRQEDVIFTGRVPKEEVFDYIKVMDICAAPDAAWYQSPVKIFEYGAMGKPILGPDTAAVREVMEPDKDGVLVDSTVDGVKKGLQRLLHDKKQGMNMASNFQNKILNDYTWQKNAQIVLGAIRQL